MAQNRKYYALLISVCFLMGTVSCGSNSNKEQSDEVIVSEPYSILLYFEKKHSGDLLELRTFEANTKGQFDRLVNKYKMHYDQKNCLYEFDKEFFKQNKVYVFHTNYYKELYDRKYKIEKKNDVVEIAIYESYYTVTTDEVKKGYHGDLMAVSKEFAKDVKDVRVQYKEYNDE